MIPLTEQWDGLHAGLRGRAPERARVATTRVAGIRGERDQATAAAVAGGGGGGVGPVALLPGHRGWVRGVIPSPTDELKPTNAPTHAGGVCAW